MELYPDIEIQKGRFVSLVRGEMDHPILAELSPLEMAMRCVDEGAEWLHVIDLDRIVDDGNNDDVVRDILDNANIPVQVGGGIRTLARARELLDAGATRVVIGSAAVADPGFLKQLVAVYPRRVVVSVDVWKERVVVQGWKVSTSYDPIEYIRLLNPLDLAAIILTDVGRDMDLPDSSLALTMQIADEATAQVITSGTIKTLDDIARVRFLPSIAGAIVGRALVKGTFTLPEALAVARQ